jgi:hypothetical protein
MDEEPDVEIIQTPMQSGFNKNDVFSLDKYPNLYLKARDMLRIKKAGKVELIVEEKVRRPTYGASANIAFPHLYPNGEISMTDMGKYTLAEYLLRKQTLYAHEMSDGSSQWTFADDDIHMMYQFARLTEMRVHARVGYYLSQHPDTAHLPIDAVLQACKSGPNNG